MVQVDINAITAVDANELSTQDKEEFYENLVWMDLDQKIPPDKFEPLFRLARELLKYKGEQVEALLADLDVLAANAGNGEVRNEKHTEELVVELQAKERELMEEKSLVEKLQIEVADLHREKNELRREIILIQNEQQSGGLSASLNEETLEDVAQLKDTIHHKNKHILQLLSDIEVFEKENDTLNKKLNTIRRELSEATTNLTKISSENISLRQASYEFKEQISNLEERNSAYSTQISELITERARKDANLDELIDALEERVAKWQDIFTHKEREVEELKTKLNEISQSSSTKQSSHASANYTALIKTIEEQEEVIDQLKNQLKQAGDDLTKSTVILQEFKKKTESKDTDEDSSSRIDEIREELNKARQHISYLQEKVNEAEQEAQFRAEEMTELIIQLKEYEDGVYGLSEARKEVKETKKQLSIRDKQILNLVQEINEMHLKAGDDVQIDSEKILSNVEDEDRIDELDLKAQLNQVQQTAIHLSMQNFDLKAQIKILSSHLDGKSKPPESEDGLSGEDKVTSSRDLSVSQLNVEELEEGMKRLIEENNGLRKGLQEIMNSIHDQDGSSNVFIESKSLERVLELLDARHISGWYHPAMRLQAALNKMQGINDALRQQLHESRYRESYFQAELQTSYIRIEELEESMSEIVQNPAHPVPAPRKIKETQDVVDATKDEQLAQEENRVGEEENGEVVEAEEEGQALQENIDTEPAPGRREEATETNFISSESIAVQTDIQPTSAGSVRSVNGSIKNGYSIRSDGSGKNSRKSSNGTLPGTPISSRKSSGDNLNEAQTKEIHVGQAKANGAKSQIEIDKNSFDEKDVDTSENGNSFRTKFNKIEANEMDLREKCEQLRRDFEIIKKSTEETLMQLNKNKDSLIDEFRNAMQKVNEELERMQQTSSTVNPSIQLSNLESAAATFQTQESKLFNYGLELVEHKKLTAEKDAIIMQLEEKINVLQTKLDTATVESREANDKRVVSLKETVTNFKNLIKQKEGVIEKYKILLERSSEESTKLAHQIVELEDKLAKQPKRENLTDSKAVTVLMEKWLIRVHNLEDEIRDLTFRLNESNCALIETRKEVDNWKHIASNAKENTDYIEEDQLAQKDQEIEELRANINEIKTNAESTFKNKIRNEIVKFKKKEEEFRTKMKNYEAEISKLKHMSTIKSSKSTNKAVKREFMLLDRIKQLEEELENCKSRERNKMQIRKDKCAEEVAKWEEKKKLQAINEKCKLEIKEKSMQIEMYDTQISRLKSIISKMEKERVTLQRRLKMSEELLAKSMTGLSSRNSSLIDKGVLDESRLIGTPKYTPRSHSDSPNNEDEQSRADLIRAVAALRKVISKLRDENSNFVHKDFVKKLQNELHKMEENYMDAVERNLSLEEQLRQADAKLCSQNYLADSGGDRNAFQFLKDQLDQKCELLSKVKELLQRAILREKQLIQQVTLLKTLIPAEKMEYYLKEVRET